MHGCHLLSRNTEKGQPCKIKGTPEFDRLRNLIRLSLEGNDLTGCVSDVVRESMTDFELPICETPRHSEDAAALAALYEATNGDHWTKSDNWLSDQPLGQWHGVSTDSSGRVVRLTLWENNLSGSLPQEVTQLSELSNLGLPRNQLTGSIPAEIGNLHYLVYLNLSDNHLSGRIPSEIAGLSNLVALYLNGNQLEGCVPVGSLDKLVEFSLGGLQFCP